MKKYIKISYEYIKKYHSRSLAIGLSIILSTILIVGIGTISKSAKQTEVDIIKYDTGSSHLRLSKINENQLDTLKSIKDINNIGVTSLYDSYNYKDKVLMNIVCADKEYLELDDGSLKEGNFPKNVNEIVLEEWVLKNLNISSKIGTLIKLELDSGKVKEFKLVGILNDIPSKKSSGVAEAIIGFDDSVNKDNYMIFIEFNEDVNILAHIYDIKEKLSLKDENVSINTMLLDALNKAGSIDWNIVIISILVSLVSSVVIYGVFNISIYQRIREYGVLRAIGAKKLQIFNIIFVELLLISLVSLPVGIILGFFGARLLSSKFSQLFTEFDVSNMNISISGDILILSIILVLIIITIISLKTSSSVSKISPIDAIKKINTGNKRAKCNLVSINKLSKLVSYHRALSFKNISENKKSFVMIVTSMSLGSVLFIGSSYYASIQNKLSDEKLQQTKVNYDYKIVTNGTLNMDKGLTKEDVDKVRNIEGIEYVNPTKIVYSRTIINKKDIIEPLFFEILEKSSSDWETAVKEYNNKNIIMQSNIWGYSDESIKELNKFLIDGEINISKMKEENSVVVYIPTLGGQGSKKVVDISSGDTISVTFRKDGKVSEDFYGMKDVGEYVTKKFKVAGVVTTLPVWDDYYSVQEGVDIILPEQNYDKVCGFDNYRILHANKKNNVNSEQIMEELLGITNSLEGVSVRDLSKERVEIENYYSAKDSYIYIISAVLFIISILNITNNISYRLMSRTTEFGMLRAVGLDERSFRQMIRFEGISFGVISSIVSIILSLIIQIAMFTYFSVFLKNPVFELQWINYILIVLINILIGILATYIPLRKIKKLSIIESIKSIE